MRRILDLGLRSVIAVALATWGLGAGRAAARPLQGSGGGCFSGQSAVPGGIDTCAPFFAPAQEQERQRQIEEMRRLEPKKEELKPLFVPPIVSPSRRAEPPHR